jgi:hypothetical protein
MDRSLTLLKIQALLDGTEWHVGILDEIATILRDAGYNIRDPGYFLRNAIELKEAPDED